MTIPQNTVKEIGEVKLVGFRVLCEGERYMEEIPKAARSLNKRKKEIKHVTDSGRHVGAFVVEESSPEEDGYWIGVQVRDYEDIPEGMTTLTIPPQQYATTLHKGPNDQIRTSYAALHKWIEEKGYTRADNRWNLERYHEETDPENPSDVHVELCDSIL
ncbi:GyrI-like domain-containing protein [Halobacillus locisalis]|uniref:GyrI-like domain-containing protein n=1 Tax=Halobacillus locisalis TaxID=220753 RepID=A0A838CSC2_9BACI|nr:GyrI-like domain-containing protein [Halobacillus locisalis]